MENLFLTVFEHNYLRNHKLSLEADYNIKITLPVVDESAVFCPKEVVLAKLEGEDKNIEIVKKLMKEESGKDRCVAVITLSDSDGPPVLSERQNRVRRRKRKRFTSATPTKPATQGLNNSGPSALVGSSPFPLTAEKFIPLTPLPPRRKRPRKKWTQKALTPQSPQGTDDSIILIQDDAVQVDQSLECQVSANDSVILLEEKPVVPTPSADDSIILLEEKPVAVPRPIQPRMLRPVVIDGNNVAREHGKGSSTYSCKGIKLAVDFFLLRGHTQVTAFVPNFRRHKVHGPFPTTDPHILEEMALGQRVVFTPSRNLNGKRMTCYDDRFIVELASTTDGVILSNDNYRDLVGESEAFKKTIEERLLMFCFVGDKLMIPQDPMGRNGPSLDTYLSLPPPPPEGSTVAALSLTSPPITII